MCLNVLTGRHWVWNLQSWDSKNCCPGTSSEQSEPLSSGGLESTFTWAVCFDLLACPFCLGQAVGSYFTEEVQRLNVLVKSCVSGWGGGLWLRQWYKDEKISPEMETQVWPLAIKSFASGLGWAPPRPPPLAATPPVASINSIGPKQPREGESPWLSTGPSRAAGG